MKERVERLLRLLEEAEVVKNIAASENPVEEYKKYEGEFSENIIEIQESYDKGDIDEDECDYEITPENSTSWCMLFIMTTLDECDLGVSYTVLEKALDEVEGDLEQIAYRMARFASLEMWSDYEAEDLIEKFFY